jgi:FkbM family methyltransferase
MMWEGLRSNVVRPLRRVAGRVLRAWPFPVRVGLDAGGFLYVDLRSPVGRAVAAKGVFGAAVLDVMSKIVREGGVFLDIGANIGFYSIAMSRIVGARGEVHAFEADPRALRCLTRTAHEARLENLIVHPYAMGPRADVASLVTTTDCAHTSVGGENGPKIPMIPLDTFEPYFAGRRVELIKVDVEGFELPVLQGAVRILRQHRPAVICEANSLSEAYGYDRAEIAGFLASLGYFARPIVGAADGDILFVHGSAQT